MRAERFRSVEEVNTAPFALSLLQLTVCSGPRTLETLHAAGWPGKRHLTIVELAPGQLFWPVSSDLPVVIACPRTAQPWLPRVSCKGRMIDVTPSATDRIRSMLAAENPGGLLRLGVIGGGCSGLQYKFKFERNPRASDNVFEIEGVKLCVDPKSYRYLDGMTLDYVETILEQRFLFKNPNADKSCGCGKSFQV